MRGETTVAIRIGDGVDFSRQLDYRILGPADSAGGGS